MHTHDLPTFEVLPLESGRYAVSCLTCLASRQLAYWTVELDQVPMVLSTHAAIVRTEEKMGG